MTMHVWEWETFEEVVNSAACSVTNPGPLRAPIDSLSIRRDEERGLILATTCPGNASSSVKPYPAGTVRRSDDIIEFATLTGFTAVARGVTPRHWNRLQSLQTGSDITKEESSLHSLILKSQHGGNPHYTIEWIDNFDAESFSWFGNITDKSTSVDTRVLGKGDDAITLKSTSTGQSGGTSCRKLNVGDMELYLGASVSGLPKILVKPGFILYRGVPDEETREKVRNCVSFALGNYLVYLGCTVLDEACHAVSMTAVNADRHDRIFKVAVLPPAPLENRYEREVDPIRFSRLVNALYAKYDELQFGHLSWAYWHAVCAPTHNAAAQFGAGVEALQGAYIEAHPGEFQTKLVDDKRNWQQVQSKLIDIIKAAGFATDVETVFTNKITGLNSVPTSKLSEQVFNHLGIRMGDLEKKAWKERHMAAHGDLTSADPIATIKNTKLLKLLFHRLLLKMTNGSDEYRDYYTLNFPKRKLEDPVAQP
jgi:hypothetical protein